MQNITIWVNDCWCLFNGNWHFSKMKWQMFRFHSQWSSPWVSKINSIIYWLLYWLKVIEFEISNKKRSYFVAFKSIVIWLNSERCNHETCQIIQVVFMLKLFTPGGLSISLEINLNQSALSISLHCLLILTYQLANMFTLAILNLYKMISRHLSTGT